METKINRFDKIFKSLQNLDYYSGLGILKDRATKNSWKEILFTLHLSVFFINFIIVMISTIIVSKYSLLSWIISGSAFGTFMLQSYLALKLKFNRSKINEFLAWCRNLHEIDAKYHPLLQQEAKFQLEKTENLILQVLKYHLKVFLSMLLFATSGFAILGLFLPRHIYPKFSSPIPLYYPYYNEKTWKSFILTVIGFTNLSTGCACLLSFTNCIFFSILLYILTFLDIIKYSCGLMKEQLDFKFVVMKNEDEKGDDQKINQLSFDEWIKILVDMITEVNQIISNFSKFYTGFFFVMELSCFGGLFMAGMVFLVIHHQFTLLVGSASATTLLYLICFANEKILEKFDELQEQLYDLPWHAMTPKDRKKFLLAFNCINIQDGFNACGFHKLNNARFYKIIKFAYTNSLILRDLINK